MIIQYHLGATQKEMEQVRERVRSWGLRIAPSTGEKASQPEDQIHVDNVFGPVTHDHRHEVRTFSCVQTVIAIEGVPQNLSKVRRGGRHQVTIPNKWGGPDVVMGGNAPLAVLAGVCAVDKEFTEPSHQMAKRAGAAMNRGGAFKPRTSPYDFQGLKEEGLKVLCEARAQVGLPVVSEILDVRDLELFMKYDVDMLQVGTRNAQNFELLIEVGRSGKPVLYKRGFSNSMEEYLKGANYVMEQGNENLVLCLRGVKGIGHSYRNQGDLDEIVYLSQLTDRPIVYDVSHSTGKKSAVAKVGDMAAAGGADGILLDVHVRPDKALVDGFQALEDEAQLAKLIRRWSALRELVQQEA